MNRSITRKSHIQINFSDVFGLWGGTLMGFYHKKFFSVVKRFLVCFFSSAFWCDQTVDPGTCMKKKFSFLFNIKIKIAPHKVFLFSKTVYKTFQLQFEKISYNSFNKINKVFFIQKI